MTGGIAEEDVFADEVDIVDGECVSPVGVSAARDILDEFLLVSELQTDTCLGEVGCNKGECVVVFVTEPEWEWDVELVWDKRHFFQRARKTASVEGSSGEFGTGLVGGDSVVVHGVEEDIIELVVGDGSDFKGHFGDHGTADVLGEGALGGGGSAIVEFGVGRGRRAEFYHQKKLG